MLPDHLPKIRVLVVDDNKLDRISVRRRLSHEGANAEVIEAGSLREGIRIASEQHVDIVLLDLGLGETTGLTTFERFHEQVPDVPVIIRSAMPNEAIAVQVIQSGAQDFIQKDIGESRWLSISLRNAIQRHQLWNQLQQANRDLLQFASVASHDLQEPLRAIRWHAESMLDAPEDFDKEEAQHLAQRIAFAATRMQNLVRDLLAFAESGVDSADFVDVDLNRCVDEVRENLRHVLDESGARLTVEHLPSVRGIPHELTQLLQNLIGNALKYRSASPEVHVGHQRSGDFLDVFVRDNGIGIEPRHHQQIFGLCKRLHRQEEYPGTGVGLAICQRITERHGGTLSVESTTGNGATFTVRLPVGL